MFKVEPDHPFLLKALFPRDRKIACLENRIIATSISNYVEPRRERSKANDRIKDVE